MSTDEFLVRYGISFGSQHVLEAAIRFENTGPPVDGVCFEGTGIKVEAYWKFIPPNELLRNPV